MLTLHTPPGESVSQIRSEGVVMPSPMACLRPNDAVSNIGSCQARYASMVLADVLQQTSSPRELDGAHEVIAAHLRHAYTEILLRRL